MMDAPLPDRARAYAPGRVNLIGEHTDYNGGLALPFAVDRGITVTATRAGVSSTGAAGAEAFLRGAAGELRAAGVDVPGATIDVESDPPEGSGLSSSAALSAALVLALLALAGEPAPDRLGLARLCSRIENDWVGARTGMLDQVAVLLSPPGAALLIDFQTTTLTPVALDLGDWRLAVIDSGAAHRHAKAGYNDRRAECDAARAVLGVPSLRDATAADLARLAPPLDARVCHVIGENDRVRATVAALEARDFEAVGRLLDESHASLRDDYDVSVPEVEAARDRALAAGAAGARIMGGGFGGAVLALFGPDTRLPDCATEVTPSVPARVVR